MQFIDVKQDSLVFANTDIPDISGNRCLIKVRAIGVNRADILQKQGKYPAPKGESPILGLEVAGVIVKLPKNGSRYKIGDKVCALIAGGGYAEFVAINEEHLIKLPQGYSFEQGGALAEVFLTAYQSLFSIGLLQPKSKVLIHAGASGVGTAAIQLSKAIGCYVVTTVSNNEKVNACRELGADVAINYKEQSFVQWAKEHATKFDLILDVVSGDYVNQNIDVAGVDARIVILSILGGRFAKNVDIAKMLQKRIQITASTLRNRSDDYKASLVKNFIEDFGDQIAKQTIKPIIYQSYPWKDVELAHHCMMSNENIGKLVLTIDES